MTWLWLLLASRAFSSCPRNGDFKAMGTAIKIFGSLFCFRPEKRWLTLPFELGFTKTQLLLGSFRGKKYPQWFHCQGLRERHHPRKQRPVERSPSWPIRGAAKLFSPKLGEFSFRFALHKIRSHLLCFFRHFPTFGCSMLQPNDGLYWTQQLATAFFEKS